MEAKMKYTRAEVEFVADVFGKLSDVERDELLVNFYPDFEGQLVDNDLYGKTLSLSIEIDHEVSEDYFEQLMDLGFEYLNKAVELEQKEAKEKGL